MRYLKISLFLALKRLTAVVLVSILVHVAFPLEVSAQDANMLINLNASQYELDRLVPGETVGQAEIIIDQSDTISVEVIATTELNTSIEGPAGEILDENTTEDFGGQFTSFQGAQAPEGPLIMPVDSPGFHYMYVFPSLGPGNYIVHFEADPSLSEEVAVITQVLTDSPVSIALIATESKVTLGAPAVLSALVFEGSRPVPGAVVSVWIRPEDGSPVSLSLVDDGGDTDDVMGDGLYSGEFFPDSAGRYRAVAEIHGFTYDGTPFSRESATDFAVIALQGRLTGNVDDRGVDDDADGVFERVAVAADADMMEAGNYQLFVHLSTDDNKNLVRNTEVNLSEGVQTIEVNFVADDLLGLGKDGPYSISLIELDFLGDDITFTADKLVDPAQTRAYLLSQFQLMEPGDVSGKVTDDVTGAPISGVDVLIYDVNGDSVAEVSTDATGQYRVGPVLHPGNYLATTRNTQGFIDEIYSDIACSGLCGSPNREGTLIRVEAGRVTPSIDFALAK